MGKAGIGGGIAAGAGGEAADVIGAAEMVQAVDIGKGHRLGVDPVEFRRMAQGAAVFDRVLFGLVVIGVGIAILARDGRQGAAL